VTPTTPDSVERAFGKRYGEASGYLLKYRKVTLPTVTCEPGIIPHEFHEDTEK
jgi:glycogen debranching enzyme